MITTPGIAYLARKDGFAAGIVISASHNPWQDNGIKIFGSDGYKLPDEIELGIEDGIFRQIESGAPAEILNAPPTADPQFVAEYEEYLLEVISGARS